MNLSCVTYDFSEDSFAPFRRFSIDTNLLNTGKKLCFTFYDVIEDIFGVDSVM
jgi:hypothetical protein